MCEYIDGFWLVLMCFIENIEKWDFLLLLLEFYVVLGGCFCEVYYWDSYFIMLGFVESGYWDKVVDMVVNFVYEIDIYGYIFNGNCSYYLSCL